MSPFRINPSSAQRQNETSSAGEHTSAGGQAPALPAPGSLEGLERRGPRPETSGARGSDLPEELWLNVAERLDVKDAQALSSTSKKMHATADKVVVMKALSTSRNWPASVHGALRKAAALPESEAHARIEILQGVAGKIGQSTEQPVELVHAFLRTIGPLSPAHRAKARAALEASLTQLPAHHRPAAFALVKYSAELALVDTLPDGERSVRLTALARQVSSLPNGPVRLAVFDDLVDRVGPLPGEHRAELLTALVSQLAALPEEATQPRVHQLIALSQALPIDQLGQLPLQLVQKMVSPTEPSEAFDRTWHQAMGLAAGATAAAPQHEQIATLLADKIPGLTPTARQEAFDRTIALVLTLPPQRPRADGLEHLAKTVESLPEAAPGSANEGRPGRAAALHQILKSLAGVDLKQRAGVLTASAAAVKHVTHQRQEVFDSTLSAMESLPMSWQRKSVLDALVDVAKSPAHGSPDNEFGKVLQSAASLDTYSDDRASVVLNAARALCDVSHPGSLPLLILEQVPNLPPAHHRSVVDEILRSTKWAAMSPEDLTRNANAALSALSRLPTHNSGEVAMSAALNLPMLQMAAGERGLFFSKLLQQAERAPHAGLLQVLSRKMRDAHDPELLQQSFPSLLRLVGEQLPGAYSALMYLAQQLSTLPETEVQAAWTTIRSLTDQNPPTYLPDLDRVVAELAAEVPRLKPQMQGEAVAWVQQSIPRLFEKTDDWGSRHRALAKLGAAIPALPEELRQGAFETVLTHVEHVLEADRRASPRSLCDDTGRQLHRDERGAALLTQLARTAGSLPGLAPRTAVNQVLAALKNVYDDASQAEALKSLAREALPAALERPVTLGMRMSNPLKRHVSRESLLQSFAKQVDELPPRARVPALRQMLEDARVHANGKSSDSSDDKSGKLPALLDGLMEKAIHRA